MKTFNPAEFYGEYPSKVILRPGYPARAQFKSLLLWKEYGDSVLERLNGRVDTYADIGGCFGFGANAMAFHISQSQGFYPETKVFEISPDYVKTGKILFPYIDFVLEDFVTWDKSPKIFDLISMFDVIEHIPDPKDFLVKVAEHCRFALLKTPIETGGDWFGAKPPKKQGSEHSDGHINFFTPATYLKLLNDSGLCIIKGKFVWSIIPFGSEKVLDSEYYPKSFYKKSKRIIPKIVPYRIMRKLAGLGDHICLVQSKKSLNSI